VQDGGHNYHGVVNHADVLAFENEVRSFTQVYNKKTGPNKAGI
jgi:hypothetical protein